MLNAIVGSMRFILLIVCGHKQVALENAALHQQLAVYKRNVPRPKLNNEIDYFGFACASSGGPGSPP
jgi:hypothetical protein